MTPEGREPPKRVSRFRIVVFLAAVLAAGVFSMVALTLVQRGGVAPSFGWSAASRSGAWIIDAVDSAGPAAGVLRAGDRLVSFDGDTRVAWYGPSWYRVNRAVGRSYTLRIERDRREIEQTLRVGAGRRHLAERLVYLAVSLVWCAVGLFIGFSRPGDAVARLAFAAAVATGFVYAQVAGSSFALPGGIGQPLHMVLGYHFFYRFPAGVRRGSLSRALLWLFYAWGVASCAFLQQLNWTLFTHGAGATAAWVAQNALLLRLVSAVGAAAMFPMVIAPVALLATAYRGADAGKRRRIRWVVYASVAGLSPLVLWAAFALAGAIASPGPSPIPPASTSWWTSRATPAPCSSRSAWPTRSSGTGCSTSPSWCGGPCSTCSPSARSRCSSPCPLSLWCSRPWRTATGRSRSFSRGAPGTCG